MNNLVLSPTFHPLRQRGVIESNIRLPAFEDHRHSGYHGIFKEGIKQPKAIFMEIIDFIIIIIYSVICKQA